METPINITVETDVNLPVSKVWNAWTDPVHIVKWNQASENWHTTRAENDLRTGGKFSSRMEAMDGSFGFDFFGTYDEVVPHKKIEYTLGDGRKVKILFSSTASGTKVSETFEAETENSPELQKTGWQAIMDNFKSYTESLG